MSELKNEFMPSTVAKEITFKLFEDKMNHLESLMDNRVETCEMTLEDQQKQNELNNSIAQEISTLNSALGIVKELFNEADDFQNLNGAFELIKHYLK